MQILTQDITSVVGRQDLVITKTPQTSFVLFMFTHAVVFTSMHWQRSLMTLRTKDL